MEDGITGSNITNANLQVKDTVKMRARRGENVY